MTATVQGLLLSLVDFNQCHVDTSTERVSDMPRMWDKPLQSSRPSLLDELTMASKSPRHEPTIANHNPVQQPGEMAQAFSELVANLYCQASNIFVDHKISGAPPTLTHLKENYDGDPKSFPDHAQKLNLPASERHCNFIRETIRFYNMV